MRTLTILVTIFMLPSCTVRDVSKHKKEFNHLISDSLLVQGLAERASALNFPQINQGVDSFELRIWHGITIAKPNQLTILKYQDSSWHLTLTDYWISHNWINGSLENVIFDSSFSQSLQVPMSISTIVDSINQFRLNTFPSQKEIPNFRHRVADGMFYEIEIATPHYYKALNYNNPRRYNDFFNRRITAFLITLSEIGVSSGF